jgi:hypothetical protein
VNGWHRLWGRNRRGTPRSSAKSRVGAQFVGYSYSPSIIQFAPKTSSQAVEWLACARPLGAMIDCCEMVNEVQRPTLPRVTRRIAADATVRIGPLAGAGAAAVAGAAVSEAQPHAGAHGAGPSAMLTAAVLNDRTNATTVRQNDRFMQPTPISRGTANPTGSLPATGRETASIHRAMKPIVAGDQAVLQPLGRSHRLGQAPQSQVRHKCKQILP